MSRQISLEAGTKEHALYEHHPLSMLGQPLGAHYPMAKTDYQPSGACVETHTSLFIRALGTASVPWGNLRTPPDDD
jgi:hypothetical protein